MLDINKLIRAEKLAPCEADEFMLDLDAWTEDNARELAHSEHLDLNEEHMDVICWLRDHFAECGPSINGRALSHAMEESFMAMGGLKYLYQLFPQGPVYQGCRLAGLPVPPGSRDRSFGSTH
jgi:TusE/DsrC/DsvC family sulfur relay protein